MNARGFTLVESMIGIVILALGLLGAWAMLLSGLRSHGDALYRSAATHLLRDMADRIRANPAAGSLYDTRHERSAPSPCEDATACDAAQTAAADIAWFAATASASFPAEGLATNIAYEPAIGPASTDRYSLSLTWRGPRDTEAANVVALEVLAQPVAG